MYNNGVEKPHRQGELQLGAGGYGTRAPIVFRNAQGIAALGPLLGTAFALIAGLRRKSSRTSNAHGSSRWASTQEIKKAALLRDAGVVLCQTSDAQFRTTIDSSGKTKTTAPRLGQLVRHDGPEHVFCFAPTRSGKGVGLVIPTLLSWPHSVLVYDIKKENWALTAGWRQKFSRTWRFEPTATDSVRFNPLFEIRKGLSEVKDVQNVADILVDPTGEKDSKDHWQTTAHSLLCGAILHVLYAEPDKTLAGVASFLSDPNRTQMDTLQRMLTTSHLATGPHPVVSQAAREMLNKSENELSGVFSTAMSCLGLYRDPVIAQNTSAKAVDPTGVEQGHVYLKPTRPGLETNLAINTDHGHAYMLELHSYEDTYMAMVTWRFPQEEVTKLAAEGAAQAAQARDSAPIVSLSALNFDYLIQVTKGRPPWTPVQVFDDGRRTFVRFPQTMLVRETPALFVLSGGDTQLVNYRMKNDFYVVDRLLESAELRLGTSDSEQIVRITRARP